MCIRDRYEGDLDHIIGFIHIKDIYPLIVKKEYFEVTALLREIQFVPETMPIDKVAHDCLLYTSRR